MARLDPAPLLDLPGVRPVLAALPGARIVGGAVRDLLAGRAVSDVDVATPLLPQTVMERLRAVGLRAIPTGLAHGTVTALADGGQVEVTTLRRDVETDGRHAVVAFTEDFEIDAARRDFTINAMSLGPDGALYDYFGGVADLAAGRVRFVGEPSLRIAEDYLRILRFFRFHLRYGQIPPDADTATALAAAAPKLATLSAERLWSETSKILSGSDPRSGLRLMDELGVLAVLLPEAAADWTMRLDRLAEADAPPDPVLRLAGLIGDPHAADLAARRLKLSKAERERLVSYLDGPLPALGAPETELFQAAADTTMPLPVLRGRSFLRHPPGNAARAFRAELEKLVPPVFPLQGRDVVALGLEPGPELGRALRAVRLWWVRRGCLDDAESCRAELARVVGRFSS
ncbi:CCA tRNA nucleotidyltransferase [Acidisoma cellulosilytica]|uniref:CCA tRNA nucleotidyltransferase n=1 Tax=Acidisoma cellulosilyticum TaxID=2802395 RepID=A0A964E3J1_9PROT|nr:CCA tRNA nucleotidyltransferase [Acidisoma cellulosilyticum]MCB8880710.1 CCA tRNA nucleotidyltransferase [Acidisoma cellulosilyticum]